MTIKKMQPIRLTSGPVMRKESETSITSSDGHPIEKTGYISTMS